MVIKILSHHTKNEPACIPLYFSSFTSVIYTVGKRNVFLVQDVYDTAIAFLMYTYMVMYAAVLYSITIDNTLRKRS